MTFRADLRVGLFFVSRSVGKRLGKTEMRNNETARPRDHGTARPRDNGTTGLLKNTVVLRHSQPFSVVRGCAWLCVAAWRESGADTTLGEFRADGLY